MTLFDKLKAYIGLERRATTPDPDSKDTIEKASEILGPRFMKKYPPSAAHAFPSYPDPSRDYEGDYEAARQRLLETGRIEYERGMTPAALADKIAARMKLPK